MQQQQQQHQSMVEDPSTSRKRALSAGDARTTESTAVENDGAQQPTTKRRCASRDGSSAVTSGVETGAVNTAAANNVFSKIRAACTTGASVPTQPQTVATTTTTTTTTSGDIDLPPPPPQQPTTQSVAVTTTTDPNTQMMQCDGDDDDSGDESYSDSGSASDDSSDTGELVSIAPKGTSVATVKFTVEDRATGTTETIVFPPRALYPDVAAVAHRAQNTVLLPNESTVASEKKKQKKAAPQSKSRSGNDNKARSSGGEDASLDLAGRKVELPVVGGGDSNNYYEPTRAQYKADKKSCGRLRLVKHLARYVPQRACGRCSLCRAKPCGACKSCAYNVSIEGTRKSHKRCMALKCERVVDRDRKYEIETSADFRLLQAQLSSLEQTRTKNATQQVTAYKAGKNQRAAVHRTMKEAAELAMAHIIERGADTLLIDEACRTDKYKPYFMRGADSTPTPAPAPAPMPIPASPQPGDPQTVHRVAPK